VPHYSLVTLEGVSLGSLELERADWRPGSVIHRGNDERDLRVVDVIEADDPDSFAVLVVDDAVEG
jgi:hypothetical protein